MKKFFYGITACLMILSLLTACGSKPEKAIVGRWDGSEVMGRTASKWTYSYAFYENGSYDRFRNTEGEELETEITSGHGTWSIVDEDSIRISDYAVGPSVYDFELDGDKLILDGETFTRSELN